MTDTPSAVDRIERAVARIEAAAARHATARRTLAVRHAALRDKMAETVVALDAMLGEMDER